MPDGDMPWSVTKSLLTSASLLRSIKTRSESNKIPETLALVISPLKSFRILFLNQIGNKSITRRLFASLGLSTLKLYTQLRVSSTEL